MKCNMKIGWAANILLSCS